MKKTPLLALALLASLSIGVGVSHAGPKIFGDGADLPDFLKTYDVNEDGVIDEEERQAIKAARKAAHAARKAELDTDGNGKISSEERAAARESILAAIEAKRLVKFNEIAGDDGVISVDEFSAIPALEGRNDARVQALFERLDADDTDTITADEFNARLTNHRGRGRKHNHGAKPGHGPSIQPGHSLKDIADAVKRAVEEAKERWGRK